MIAENRTHWEWAKQRYIYTRFQTKRKQFILPLLLLNVASRSDMDPKNPSPDLHEVHLLAEEIASKTKAYLEILHDNDHQTPPGGTSNVSTTALAATAARTRLMELTTELQFLIQGPRLYVHNQILSVSQHMGTYEKAISVLRLRTSM